MRYPPISLYLFLYTSFVSTPLMEHTLYTPLSLVFSFVAEPIGSTLWGRKDASCICGCSASRE